jgi:hypothetical protein
MREAVISADLDQFLETIKEVDICDARVIQGLKRLAEHFEYQKLLDLMGPGRPSTSSLRLAGAFHEAGQI